MGGNNTMVLDYDFVIKFKNELMNKQSVYLHFHDGCGGQYFTLEKTGEEIRKCIGEFLSDNKLKASFSNDGLQFTVDEE